MSVFTLKLVMMSIVVGVESEAEPYSSMLLPLPPVMVSAPAPPSKYSVPVMPVPLIE